MSSWGIAEWYGQDIRTMSPSQRKSAAETALLATEVGLEQSNQPACPFLSTIKPGAVCNKAGGVCSIREFTNGSPVKATDTQPAAVCPNRFLEAPNGKSIFGYIASEFFDAHGDAKVIKEVPFLHKVDADGRNRGSKAGRIDWVVVPTVPHSRGGFDWAAIETQAVYFSGARMNEDFEAYAAAPGQLHGPRKNRRPDYRSSGAKRLAPQLDAKSPVMRRWGKKVVVVVDRAFFDEFSAFASEASDFDNAEVVWMVMRFDDSMTLVRDRVIFAELRASIDALQATRPVNKAEFEDSLMAELSNSNSAKVYDA